MYSAAYRSRIPTTETELGVRMLRSLSIHSSNYIFFSQRSCLFLPCVFDFVPLVTSTHFVALPLNPLKLAASLKVMAETHFQTTGSRSCRYAACGLNSANSRPGVGEPSKTSKIQSHSKMKTITLTDQGDSSRAQGEGTTGSLQTSQKGKSRSGT
jgi:hypothetical protein